MINNETNTLRSVIDFMADKLNLSAIEALKITDLTKIKDLSEDSIQLFELLIAFEDKYNFQIGYDDVLNLQTVGDIVVYLINNSLIKND